MSAFVQIREVLPAGQKCELGKERVESLNAFQECTRTPIPSTIAALKGEVIMLMRRRRFKLE